MGIGMQTVQTYNQISFCNEAAGLEQTERVVPACLQKQYNQMSLSSTLTEISNAKLQSAYTTQ
jgi:hypothetical protein